MTKKKEFTITLHYFGRGSKIIDSFISDHLEARKRLLRIYQDEFGEEGFIRKPNGTIEDNDGTIIHSPQWKLIGTDRRWLSLEDSDLIEIEIDHPGFLIESEIEEIPIIQIGIPEDDRILNPIDFQFAKKFGHWREADGRIMKIKGAKEAKNPKKEEILIMDPNSFREIRNLILIAPEMAAQLETIQFWIPTIMSRLSKIEAEIFRDVAKEIIEILERIDE